VQARGVGLKGVVRLRIEAEILEPHQRQGAAEGADGVAQLGPARLGRFEQAYFVALGEDERAVFICSDSALGCFFAHLIERPKSLPVTVQNRVPGFAAGEPEAFEECLSSG